jgi:hypothetical protein
MHDEQNNRTNIPYAPARMLDDALRTPCSSQYAARICANPSAVFRYVTIRDLTQETKLSRYGRVTRRRQVLVSA